MSFHRDAVAGDIHAPNNWKYADAAERLAATGFVSSDVDKLALQEDNTSLWVLTAHDPITWKQFGGLTVDDISDNSVVMAIALG